ncbi:Uncharacterised protein [Mycobacteroides abscessus subsp. abscessus]|nr:Uncharacterised protein [Mycobacteroides abscessus subsp. abscessus]
MLPMLDFILADPFCCCRHALHHVPFCILETDIVLEKVAVGQDVGHNQFILDKRIRVKQKRVARI